MDRVGIISGVLFIIGATLMLKMQSIQIDDLYARVRTLEAQEAGDGSND